MVVSFSHAMDPSIARFAALGRYRTHICEKYLFVSARERLDGSEQGVKGGLD